MPCILPKEHLQNWLSLTNANETPKLPIQSRMRSAKVPATSTLRARTNMCSFETLSLRQGRVSQAGNETQLSSWLYCFTVALPLLY